MKDTKKAFLWITDILEKNNIKYKIGGGFAARMYGCKRELSDIDIFVPEGAIDLVASLVGEYSTFGPGQYVDENWDLKLLTLEYLGQEIDIASDKALIFNQNTKRWEDSGCVVDRSVTKEVYSKVVPIESINMLLQIKTKLARDVDIEDVRQLTEIKKNLV